MLVFRLQLKGTGPNKRNIFFQVGKGSRLYWYTYLKTRKCTHFLDQVLLLLLSVLDKEEVHGLRKCPHLYEFLTDNTCKINKIYIRCLIIVKLCISCLRKSINYYTNLYWNTLNMLLLHPLYLPIIDLIISVNFKCYSFQLSKQSLYA